MQKILISACLLGKPVRYDGRKLPFESEVLDRWQLEERLISICPETAGGLPVPRSPAEISKNDGSSVLNDLALVVNQNGDDVTQAFKWGAKCALETSQAYDIRMAVLKSRSPSCGNNNIYDGTFTGKLITGQGVTAALLVAHHIKVFNEDQISVAVGFLDKLEKTTP